MFPKDENGQADWTESLEPLHHLVAELIRQEQLGKGTSEPYTDSDIIAVTLLYSILLGNRLYYQMDNHKATMALAKQVSEHFSTIIQETTYGMSGIDMQTYYKKRKGKA